MAAPVSPRARSCCAAIGLGVAFGMLATWGYRRLGDSGSQSTRSASRAARAGTDRSVKLHEPSQPAAPPSALGGDRAAPGPQAIDSGACPAGMALVDGQFCPQLRYQCRSFVGESRSRCAEYAAGQRCLGPTDHRRFCIDRYEWPNLLGKAPTVYVSWDEAKAQCHAAGKRLCRRSEWVLACEGPKRLPFPWGFARQPSPCNIDRSSVPFDAMALERAESRERELARLWQADPIGSHPDCVSAYGVFDMAGNVDEWTDNEADNPGTDKPSTLNGGYWGPVRNTCRLTTKSHGHLFRFYQVGFRCCGDARGSEGLPPPRPWIEGDERASEGGPGHGPYDDLEGEP